jgi:hypothetical protein
MTQTHVHGEEAKSLSQCTDLLTLKNVEVALFGSIVISVILPKLLTIFSNSPLFCHLFFYLQLQGAI